MRTKILACLCLLMAAPSGYAQKLQTIEPKALTQVVTPKLQPVQGGDLQVPYITWGGDVATIQAELDGILAAEGLKTAFVDGNDFAAQVQSCLDGKTPYVRGTMGMVNAAAEVFKTAGTDLVTLYQLTWSTGGDAMVVREGINTPKDLKGKKIALQLYGPHMDYVANILQSAGIKPSEVTLVYFKELSLPKYDTKGAIVDPVSAFAADPSINAVMCISPDAMALTSGGAVGTGAEGSAKGAKILLSSKTATKIICDVYAVRKDYLLANRPKVQAFVHALMRGEEALRDRKAAKTKDAAWTKLLARSGELLLGSAQATADVEGLLSDCEFVGYAGNVAFFTGQGTTRTFETLTTEIQTSFLDMGLMAKRVPLEHAQWDYRALAAGLKYADASIAKSTFDPTRAAQRVEAEIAAEPMEWEEKGTLFVVEINFEPNESQFSADKYAADFQKALEIAQTYGGALVVIEGHSDPLGILKARQKGEREEVVAQMEQSAKNLSLSRANAVRSSYLAYAKSKNLIMDETQFVAVGMGVKSPKFSPPRTKEEWAANRRVVFRIKQFEAEMQEFTPLQ